MAFIIVRICTNLCNGKNINKTKSMNKGKLKDFDPNSELSDEAQLFEWAYRIRNNPIISRQSEPPTLLQPLYTEIEVPEIISIQSSSSRVSIDVSPWLIVDICKYICKYYEQSDIFRNNWIRRVEEFQNKILETILYSRLTIYRIMITFKSPNHTKDYSPHNL